MHSLITGGAGFIGAHVAQHCLGTGHEVVVLDDPSGGFRDRVRSPVSRIERAYRGSGCEARPALPTLR